MHRSNDFLAELGHREEVELVLAEKRMAFLRQILPQLRRIKTPSSFYFSTNYSPDMPVHNIPVSGLILYGGAVTNPNEFYDTSEKGLPTDLDIAALFPLVAKRVSDYEEDFNHLTIGDSLRREFMDTYRRKHWGKSPPFPVDIVAFPDPRYADSDYFRTRPIWQAIESQGVVLWQK